MPSSQDFLIIAVIIVGAYFIYKSKSVQKYAPLRNYQYVDSGYIQRSVSGPPNFDQEYSVTDFANMVGGIDYSAQNPHTNAAGARFAKLHDSTKLPASASYATTYDADVANPQYYSYASRNPEVILKDPLYILADPYRGDIPIKRYDNVCLITKSEHGRESQRFSGTFNPAYDDMISEYTHTNRMIKNTPAIVARESTVMDM